ncbi:hypothetical protein WH52_00670 [Tenacibaculum holothuriorum]|uniref:Transporter n=1 Tax=Tenacibaculum holothuriorum TaxID=1635173 RepID=A0A1Y2PGB6_9FLAO|nr:hypothetical protein [Tenacibaculum holothuriorum]OSY89200.1 hypothetical protein WH52_00670 [Tenacibaculum holothuriorum]
MFKVPFLKVHFCLLLIGLLSSSIIAQNYLYDTEQFGIKGATLGGSVIAGADDESMTFYNPAAIHKAPSQVSVSLFQPTVKTFGFDKFWGGNETSNLNTDFGLRPSLLSFKVKIKGLDIAFIKISKSDLNDKFSAKREIVFNNAQTTQFFEYEYSGEDRWFGAGTSFQITPKFHIGVSQFVSIANFKYRNKILLERIELDNNNLTTNFFNSEQSSDYGNTGLITKIGFLYDSEKHDFGFTVTTPKYLRIRNSGEFASTFVNIDETTNVAQQVIDNDLNTTIKTPWEFSFGYSVRLQEKRKLWVNASYYTGISDYQTALVESANNNMSWINGTKAIFNFGIGYSHEINDKLELLGGLRTNNFAYTNKQSQDGELRNTILDGNHFHFVFGTKFKFRRHNVLLGVDWGTLMDNPEEGNFNFLKNIGRLAPNLKGLKKNNINILLTYRFILDEFIKL